MVRRLATGVEAFEPPKDEFHRRLFAAELLARRDGPGRLVPTLAHARVDLNPHQIEAACFALDALPRGGAVLADEVGLGKTIEAGLVLAQLASEGRRRALLIVPASLRIQWRDELWDKFALASRVVDGSNPELGGEGIVVLSFAFAANRSDDLAKVPWDVVVIDEAHRLRNCWRPTHRTGRAIKAAINGRPKLLLTATPLQNSLLELYGLTSLLEELPLGPEDSFRARFGSGTELTDEAAKELRGRLGSVVVRTLRRQVKEYVRFTARRGMVEDFAPSAEERELYDRVSRYLRRPDNAAIDPGRRALLTLVFRKLLASSSHAIAPTLERLADGLEERVAARPESESFLADAEAFAEEAEAETKAGAEETAPRRGRKGGVPAEIRELRACAVLARSIKSNAKGEALVRALDRAFTVSASHGWPKKAVIFTESRRTQEYLSGLLAQRGYEGRITLLSGEGRTPEDRQKAVDEFRHRTQILISTEAGGEGLNLQFCNLVVNFDLPWNPQRIEQRIGRCHRYGQTRDVLVINFLNRANAADSRLYELLSDKLQLFDGVFGASDDVLGALADGLHFERRVLDIYQSCRSAEEIDAAFAALRREVEKQVQSEMARTRDLLFTRFDADVRARLKLTGEAVATDLRRHRECLSSLGASPKSHEREEEVARRVLAKPLGIPVPLAFSAATLPENLSSLHGRDGYWFVHRLEAPGAADRFLHVALVREGNGYRALAEPDAAALATLPCTQVPPGLSLHPPPLGDAHEGAIAALQKSAEARMRTTRDSDRDLSRERAMRHAEDCLYAPRAEAESARKMVEDARRLLATAAPDERAPLRAALDRHLRDYRRKLTSLRDEEARRYGELDGRLSAITAGDRGESRRTLIAAAYWRVI
jgi:superfamily II DNA/RNA helicase